MKTGNGDVYDTIINKKIITRRRIVGTSHHFLVLDKNLKS